MDNECNCLECIHWELTGTDKGTCELKGETTGEDETCEMWENL